MMVCTGKSFAIFTVTSYHNFNYGCWKVEFLGRNFQVVEQTQDYFNGVKITYMGGDEEEVVIPGYI